MVVKTWFTSLTACAASIFCNPQATKEVLPTDTISPSTTERRAALDLGSAHFKLVVADVDPQTNRIVKVFDEKMVRVNLGDEIKMNGTISEKSERDAIAALQELITIIDQHREQDVKIRGVATAAIRRTGERGEAIVNNINAILNQRAIRTISAASEGEVGFKTGTVTVLEKNPDQAPPLAVWDSGNSSFQISFDTGSEIDAITGNIGNADIRSLFSIKILGQEAYDPDKMFYRPITEDEMKTFTALLQPDIPQKNNAFKSTISQQNHHVVSIGGDGSIFSIVGKALGKNTYSKDEVKGLIKTLTNCSEEQFHTVVAKDIPKSKRPRVVPMTLFLHAVMDAHDIETVENHITAGSTKGLLITPELWAD